MWNLNNKKPNIKNIFKNIQYIFNINRLIINFILKGLTNDLSDDKLVKTESFIFLKSKTKYLNFNFIIYFAYNLYKDF